MLSKPAAVKRIGNQLQNLQETLENVSCPETLVFKVVVFIIFCSPNETKSSNTDQTTDILFRSLEEHFTTSDYNNLNIVLGKLSTNFQTESKDAENCQFIYDKIAEIEENIEIDTDSNEITANILSSIIVLAPTEISFCISQRNYPLRNEENIVFDTSAAKMALLVDQCLNATDHRIVTIPDFDRSNFNKLYQLGDYLNQQMSSRIHKYIGEVENFWPRFKNWISPSSGGVMVHGYSQQELRKILDSKLLFNFEFDWIFFSKSRITIFEAGLHFSKDEEKIIRHKLHQVFTKIIPAFQIILWFFLQHLLGKEKSAEKFADFINNHFSVVVFLADVNTHKVESLLSSVLSKPEMLDFDLNLIPESKLNLVHFVGNSSDDSENVEKFSRIRMKGNGSFTVETCNKIHFNTAEYSDLNCPTHSEERYMEPIRRALIGLFALGYLVCNEDQNPTIERLKQDPEDLDYRFQQDLKLFLKAKNRTIKETFRKALENFNLALSPQQLEILQEDPKILIVRGEPGCGKTILLLGKALEAALDENVDHIYFCTPENKDDLKKYVANFITQENFKDFYERKFSFLTNKNLLQELGRKTPKELRKSVLLMDEFYFDSGEDLEIDREKFFNFCISTFAHLRNCWITSIVVNYYWQWIEILPTYLPVEMFCVKPLNVQFRLVKKFVFGLLVC